MIGETCLRVSYSEFLQEKVTLQTKSKKKKKVMDRYHKKLLNSNLKNLFVRINVVVGFFPRNGKSKTLSVLLLRAADQWHSECHLAAWKLF